MTIADAIAILGVAALAQLPELARIVKADRDHKRATAAKAAARKEVRQ